MIGYITLDFRPSSSLPVSLFRSLLSSLICFPYFSALDLRMVVQVCPCKNKMEFNQNFFPRTDGIIICCIRFHTTQHMTRRSLAHCLQCSVLIQHNSDGCFEWREYEFCYIFISIQSSLLICATKMAMAIRPRRVQRMHFERIRFVA